MDGYRRPSVVVSRPRESGVPIALDARTGTRVLQTRTQRVLLWALIALGALTHGYHLFVYPLYITDEGIYMEQAWAVLREGRLSPYTYFYDHAPAGWIVIAGWVSLLP